MELFSYFLDKIVQIYTKYIYKYIVQKINFDFTFDVLSYDDVKI